MVLRYDPVGTKCLHTEQPGQKRLAEWFAARWGGAFLGIYACRYPRGSSSGALSFHAEGRATDWRFLNAASRDDAVAVLVSSADPLNVQRVIDYERDLSWRVDTGWAVFGGLDPGGPAIHVERNWDGARDVRPILDILNPPAPPGGPALYTALEPIGFLPALPNGHHPTIVAEVEPDGRTRIVTFGARIDKAAAGAPGSDGEVAHVPAYGVSIWRIGRLNKAIRAFGADDVHSTMIGGADDLGAFHVPVASW